MRYARSITDADAAVIVVALATYTGHQEPGTLTAEEVLRAVRLVELADRAVREQCGERQHPRTTLIGLWRSGGVSSRCRNVLQKLGVETLAGIAGISALDILRVRGAGRKTLAEVRSLAAMAGVKMKGDE